MTYLGCSWNREARRRAAVTPFPGSIGLWAVSNANWMLRWGTRASSLELRVVKYSELLFLIFARSSEDQDVYFAGAQQRVVFRNKQIRRLLFGSFRELSLLNESYKNARLRYPPRDSKHVHSPLWREAFPVTRFIRNASI